MAETLETVEIKNNELRDIYNIFYNIPLNGNKSRHRTKFVKSLEKIYSEYSEDREKMIKEFSKKDENGIIEKDPQDPTQIILDLEKYPNAKEEILELDNESNSVIVKSKSVLLDIIDSMETEHSGKTAEKIDTFAERLEEN